MTRRTQCEAVEEDTEAEVGAGAGSLVCAATDTTQGGAKRACFQRTAEGTRLDSTRLSGTALAGYLRKESSTTQVACCEHMDCTLESPRHCAPASLRLHCVYGLVLAGPKLLLGGPPCNNRLDVRRGKPREAGVSGTAAVGEGQAGAAKHPHCGRNGDHPPLPRRKDTAPPGAGQGCRHGENDCKGDEGGAE